MPDKNILFPLNFNNKKKKKVVRINIYIRHFLLNGVSHLLKKKKNFKVEKYTILNINISFVKN